MTPPLVVAVDGPAAAGKGTLARRLAAHLGLAYLDTGLLYRAVAMAVVAAGADPGDAAAAIAAARALTAEALARGDLRSPAADMAASRVAAIAAVREALVGFQRSFAAAGQGAVLDGRDIGTRIVPDAPVKLFVTAAPAVRAERRWRELRARGVEAELAAVREEIDRRDRQDATRAAAPLRQAADAVVIDTTGLSPDQAFQAALAVVRRQLRPGG